MKEETMNLKRENKGKGNDVIILQSQKDKYKY